MVNALQKDTSEQALETTFILMNVEKKNETFITHSAYFPEYNTPVVNVEAFANTTKKKQIFDYI